MLETSLTLLTIPETMTSVSDELATVPGIQAYLQDNPKFAAHTVEKLSGGLGNFTYRIHLHRAYAGCQTLVLKYAPPYAASSTGRFPLDQKRQVFHQLTTCPGVLTMKTRSSKPKHSVSQVRNCRHAMSPRLLQCPLSTYSTRRDTS